MRPLASTNRMWCSICAWPPDFRFSTTLHEDPLMMEWERQMLFRQLGLFGSPSLRECLLMGYNQVCALKNLLTQQLLFDEWIFFPR
jgi:hypothetical protein